MDLLIPKLIMIADCLPPAIIITSSEKMPAFISLSGTGIVGMKISNNGEEERQVTGWNGRNP